MVSFDRLMVTVNEGEGNAQVCIFCMELPEREIVIILESENGTAQGKYSHILTRIYIVLTRT